MKKITIIFILISIVIANKSFSFVVNKDSITIYRFSDMQCVEYALEHLTDLRNTKLDIEIQDAQNKEYLGMALPQANLKANIQRFIDIPQSYFPDVFTPAVTGILNKYGLKDGQGNLITPSAGSGGSFVTFGQNWNTSIGLSVSQVLFEPNIFISLIAMKELTNLAKANYNVAEDKIKENILKLYYSFIALKKRYQLLENNENLLKKLYYESEEAYKNGLREKLDMDRAKVALTNISTTKNKLNSTINNLYQSFKYSIGINLKDSVILTDTLKSEDAVLNLNDLSNFDYTNRNDFKLLSIAKKLREIDLKRYKISIAPTIVLAFDYSFNSLSNDLGKLYSSPNGINNYYPISLINLSFNLPLFKGFSNYNKIKQAKMQLNKVNYTLENTKNGIDLEIQNNQRNYNVEIQNLYSQSENVELAKSVYETTKNKYDEGLASSFELIDASNQINLAEDKFYETLLLVINAKISLQKSLGAVLSIHNKK